MPLGKDIWTAYEDSAVLFTHLHLVDESPIRCRMRLREDRFLNNCKVIHKKTPIERLQI